nr:zinc ABC transporter substrate-binding protein [Treponema sp.]
MKLKKIIAGAAILLALTTSVFAAKAKKSDKIKVVTTIFPEYDWAREIIGDKAANVELTLLLGNGVDLHSYQPSIQDIAKISTADIFIYVGGESDGWVADALKNATNKNMKVINLMETLGDKVKAEEVKEGMQAEDEHEHEHHHEEHNHSAVIHADDIKDRNLAEFNGEWKSLYSHLMADELEEY